MIRLADCNSHVLVLSVMQCGDVLSKGRGRYEGKELDVWYASRSILAKSSSSAAKSNPVLLLLDAGACKFW